MCVNELSKLCYEIALKRQNNGGAKVADILKHLAGEVVEAQEAFILWKYDAHDPNKYAEELADVIFCALIAAGRDEIDIKKAIADKLEKNKKRAQGLGDKI